MGVNLKLVHKARRHPGSPVEHDLRDSRAGQGLILRNPPRESTGSACAEINSVDSMHTVNPLFAPTSLSLSPDESTVVNQCPFYSCCYTVVTLFIATMWIILIKQSIMIAFPFLFNFGYSWR